MTKDKIKIFFLFFVVLLFLNIVYFSVYFSFLEISFSWLHLFFLFVGSLSYFLLINFLRAKAWHIVCYTLMAVFYFWSLINFAYFTVFNTFLDLSFGQLSQVNFGLLEMLKDFYYLIPGKLYWLTAIIAVGIIVNSILYFRFRKGKLTEIVLNDRQLKVFLKERPRNFYQVLILVVVFALVNMGAFGTCAYLAKSPKVDWWNIKEQISDLGLWGHFYTQVYAKTQEEKDIKDIKDSSEGLLKTTKDVYAELAQMNKQTQRKVVVPALNQPNVLVVQLESVPSWAIENEPSAMPFLKSLMLENVTVADFYPNSCTTNNAEFVSLCSFWPNSFEPINYSHRNNQYNCLPSILKEKYQYSTYFFHSDYEDFWSRDQILPKWGFDNLYFVPYFKLKQDDISVFSEAVSVLSQASKPFFSYIPSFSTHSPHNQDMVAYNRNVNQVNVYPFTGKIAPAVLSSVQLPEDELRQYLGFLKITDDALRVLFQDLEKQNLKENTVVLIYNDHRYYNFKGQNLKSFEYYNEAPFVMVLPEGQRGQVRELASHLDIAPTILNLVEQDSYQAPAHFVGTSLFDYNFPNQVLNKCLGQIYYKNSDLIVQGNAKSQQYTVYYEKEPLNEVEKKAWLGLVDELVQKSDETIYSDGLVATKYK